ncbi:MAG: restriction endonuclease subunit S [Galbibacter orientalis]|uniref:restriction endonuclease subunit S n=1 Tax=Galbibacter orientalis TaxID=453852 RepID=UPI00300278E9
MKEKKLVPTLRFPEFEGEWKKKAINKIASVVGGGTPSTSNKEYWNGNINWFTPTEIKHNYVESSTRKISELGLKKSSATLLPKGTILLTTRATIGEVSIANKECTTNQGFQSLIVNKLNSIYFVFNLIKNNKKQLYKRANGSTFSEISKKEVEKIKVLIPSLPEQQKIASFLTSVDEKIRLLTEKKALLEQYKKGVMQQLFSQQLRFKDDNGKDFPDWEEKRLGEIGDIVTGKTPKTSDKALWNGNIAFITPTDIGMNKYQLLVNRTVKDNKKIKILPVGTVVYTCIASIGKISITTQPSITNQQINSVIVNKQVLSEFLYYSLLKMTPKIKATLSNNTLPIINKTEFSTFKISLPSKKEQTKIADFLSSIDTKIEKVATQLQHTQQFKKGLLQQLFV